MSIQAIFDDQAIATLPRIEILINETRKEKGFIANQMYCAALREINNSSKVIDDMSAEELEKFQDFIIETFKFKEWI